MKSMKSKKKYEITGKWYDLTDKKWRNGRQLANGVYRLGKKGHKIGAYTIKTKGLRWFRGYRKGSDQWGKRIFKYGTAAKEYAGNKKRALTGVAIKHRKLAYVTHLLTKDEWLPIVYGDEYDLQDFQYGFAGDKKHAIDIIDLWRFDNMPNFSPPTNPVGTYNPCYMSNGSGGGTVAPNYYNTAIWGSPTATGANVLANCVGQVQGRALEIWLELNPDYDVATAGTHPFDTLNGQPDSFLTRAAASGLTVVYQPQVGSILVTNSHVAIIEDYDSANDRYVISESGYGKAENTWRYPQYTLYKDGNTWNSSFSYDGDIPDPLIHGFILIPGASPGPGPTPGVRFGYDRRRRYRNC